jgi:hypothetical protein
VVTLGDVVTYLSAVSAIAVILGAGFVVLQLRQNARLLEAALRQTRADISVSLIERITDPSFPQRRSRMHEIVRRFRDTDWKDAWESPDDFEIRNFAYLYELIGVMGKHGLVNVDLLVDTLQGLVVRDWEVFEPHARFMADRMAERYGLGIRPYSNFGWIAEEIRRRMQAGASRRAPAGS